MAPATDWLGPYIEEEIRSVIAWKQAIESTSEVKAHLDDRFSDDGSNFRSVINSSTLPFNTNVQISKIITIEDPVTLFVTDGFTRVKAKLSEKAVATLQADLDDVIDLDMKGDILAIREATVESTPYGPSDGFIQLAIEDIEYLYHLRKSLGQPKPIEERAETCRMIKEIENLRLKQYQPVEVYQQSSPSHHTAQPGSSASHRGFQAMDENETPRSQRSVGISHRSSPTFSQSPSTQRPLATQIPNRQKPNGPSLARDGLEMKDGVNLSRPVQPRPHETTRDVAAAVEMPPTAGGTGLRLLSLLKRKADAPLEPARPEQVASPTRLEASLKDARQESIARTHSGTELFPAVESAPTKKPHLSPKESRPRDYRRRKIPRDQQKLLDSPSSWFPSLPGYSFPHPNVPVGLLTQWNAQAKSPVKSLAVSKSPTADTARSLPVQEHLPGKAVESHASESSSSESSSEEEQLPASQWSVSPSPKKRALPPDSSNSNSRPSTAGGGTAPPTELSRIPESRAPMLRKRGSDLPPDSSALSVKPSPSPQQPSRVLHTVSRSSPREPLSSQPRHSPDGLSSRPSTSEGRHLQAAHATLNTSFMKPSPRAIKRPRESPTSTAASVVRGTQFSKTGDEEMEMAVPRSVDQDPAVEHRRRRSEHFKAAQRREWIKANYTPNPNDKSQFPRAYSAYKTAHPKDVVKLSEFAQALEDVYPVEEGSPSKAAASPIVADNVSSTFNQTRPAPTADVDGTVATPAGIPRKQTMMTTTPLSAGSGRVLPWASGKKSTPSSVRGTQNERAPSSSIFAAFKLPSSVLPSEVAAAKYEKQMRNASHTLPLESPHRQPPIANRSTSHPPPPTVAQATATKTNNTISSAAAHAQPAQSSINHILETPQTRPTEPIITESRTPQPPRIPAAQNDITATDHVRHGVEAPPSLITEFTQAWMNLKPGGAFAREAEEGKSRKALATRLDVLGWEL